MQVMQQEIEGLRRQQSRLMQRGQQVQGVISVI